MFNPNDLVRRYKEVLDVARVSKEFGVHRSTVYRWITRAKDKSVSFRGYLRHTGLKRDSRSPVRKRTYTLLPEERIAIEEVRKRYAWCAQKITKHLHQQRRLAPERGFSTVHRFLRRKGMVQSARQHRRPRFQDTVHMYLKNAKTPGKLQMDVKYVTPQLSGLTHTVFKYGVIDIYSRYKQAIILPELDIDHAIRALESILAALPFVPDFVQTDNGLEFQSRFVEFCKQKGLKHHFIHKNSPNENAVIERSFRTDEEEFYFKLNQPPKDLFHLNLLYQEYLHHYNQERPHLGLNCQTPHSILSQML